MGGGRNCSLLPRPRPVQQIFRVARRLVRFWEEPVTAGAPRLGYELETTRAATLHFMASAIAPDLSIASPLDVPAPNPILTRQSSAALPCRSPLARRSRKGLRPGPGGPALGAVGSGAGDGRSGLAGSETWARALWGTRPGAEPLTAMKARRLSRMRRASWHRDPRRPSMIWFLVHWLVVALLAGGSLTSCLASRYRPEPPRFRRPGARLRERRMARDDLADPTAHAADPRTVLSGRERRRVCDRRGPGPRLLGGLLLGGPPRRARRQPRLVVHWSPWPSQAAKQVGDASPGSGVAAPEPAIVLS